MSRGYRADLSLLAVTALWGSSFTIVKHALEDVSPMLFLALRFLVAAAFLIPWSRSDREPTGRGRLFPGILVGSFLFAGFTFQVQGLRSVTPTNSAFVTSLSVVLVPLLVVLLRRRLPAPTALVGVGLATAGLFLLLLEPEGFRFSRGDLLTFLCAVVFALHILGVDAFARREPPRRFVTIQVVTAGILATGAALLLERPVLRPTVRLAATLAFTALACTAVAFAVQTSMQRFTTPTRVAIIFATEPIFAAIVSYFVHGEPLGGRDFLGGSLIFAGILAAELRPGAEGQESPG
ncbi:MAG: DMT family transporter [Acidobacteria bacterium]|nr:DMT family transporter [Acidobacteriota bacterium]